MAKGHRFEQLKALAVKRQQSLEALHHGAAALQQARDAGVAQPERIARAYFATAPEHHALGAQYLQDNIKYHLGGAERAGLETFYRYAAEAGVVADAGRLDFY